MWVLSIATSRQLSGKPVLHISSDDRQVLTEAANRSFIPDDQQRAQNVTFDRASDGPQQQMYIFRSNRR